MLQTSNASVTPRLLNKMNECQALLRDIMDSVGVTQTELAALMKEYAGVKVSQPTIGRWKRGEMIPDADNAEAIRKTHAELVKRGRIANSTDDGFTTVLPVFGALTVGFSVQNASDVVPQAGLYQIEVSGAFGSGCVGFVVEGDGLHPFEHDSVIVCAPPPQTIGELIGRVCYVKLDDGRAFVRRILRGSRQGLYNLEAHNAAMIYDVAIVECRRKLATIEPGSWNRINREAKARAARSRLGGKKPNS